MECYAACLLLLCLLWWSIILLWRRLIRKAGSGGNQLPPGPRPLPIVGNILELSDKPHQALAKLSKLYGPVMTIKLGAITTIVISSPEAAKEALQKNDQLLSGRQIPDTVKASGHYAESVVWLPASDKWKQLRKVCTVQMFSAQKLDAGQLLRRKKVDELVSFIHQSCWQGRSVDIGKAAFTTVLNLISSTLFSVDLAHHDEGSSQEFRDLVWGVMEETGKPNVSDFFPALRWFDPQGARRRISGYFSRLLAIFDRMIEERTQATASSVASSLSNDVLDSLINLKESGELSRHEIKSLLLDLFIAGVDTSTSSLEWAMAELLHNPEKIARAREELDRVVSGDGGTLQEPDITRLPYLQAIVKETLRLHPPVPFLIPHKAESDVEIGGFRLPRHAQVLVNVWAMGRDPGVWSNPDSFMPERFLGGEIDFKGRDFELIPFGSGRRICPGMPLAYRMVHLILASLLRSFDWKLEEGVTPVEMDMTEKFGITLQKATPLCAIPMEV
ncbi:cytochrome P450 76AD1 [Eucalyptus grandis]|uniref:cytochrome P450 76AD1 n=1 Tax=Eucalyptus grandis TaxID=71139 RepID=UPI00192E970A|nr:cytochrome P450 76AD1 [Eucalyptus grandis]